MSGWTEIAKYSHRRENLSASAQKKTNVNFAGCGEVRVHACDWKAVVSACQYLDRGRYFWSQHFSWLELVEPLLDWAKSYTPCRHQTSRLPKLSTLDNVCSSILTPLLLNCAQRYFYICVMFLGASYIRRAKLNDCMSISNFFLTKTLVPLQSFSAPLRSQN